MTDEQGYNGWKNYQTWVTALWIDNDEGTYSWSREIVRDALADARWPSVADSGTIQVADALKEWAEEYMLPTLEASLAADLLGAAVDEIDWYEIAENYLGEIEPSHAPRPNPDAMPGGVFTTCAECSGTVWREDHTGDGYSSLDEGIWRHADDEQVGA